MTRGYLLIPFHVKAFKAHALQEVIALDRPKTHVQSQSVKAPGTFDLSQLD
jgi:hypothetical protein